MFRWHPPAFHESRSGTQILPASPLVLAGSFKKITRQSWKQHVAHFGVNKTVHELIANHPPSAYACADGNVDNII